MHISKNKTPVVFSLFDNHILAKKICATLNYEIGVFTQHQFPDDETLIKIDSNVSGRDVIFVASLNRPNEKCLPLLFAAETARALGALKITLIAPYLAYMRQDAVFQSGEGITCRYFARLVSNYFDCMITVDPHLHRVHDLSEIYSIPTVVVHATQSIAEWIAQNIQKPLLIGPDVESTQWVSQIAKKSQADFIVLEKRRNGDRAVEIVLPNIEHYQDFIPVIVDDIISSGVTMLAVVKQLKALNMKHIICIGIHAVFANNAYEDLCAEDVQIVTCNTIAHSSNEIDLSASIAEGLRH